jgi:hypothetical protein
LTKKIQAQAEHQKVCAVPPGILKALLSPILSWAARVGIGGLFYRWLIFFFSPLKIIVYSLLLLLLIFQLQSLNIIFLYKKQIQLVAKQDTSLVVGLYKLEMWNLVHPPSAGRKKFVYGGVVWIKWNEVDQSGMF